MSGVLVPLPPRAKGLWRRKGCIETKTISKGEAPASQKANRTSQFLYSQKISIKHFYQTIPAYPPQNDQLVILFSTCSSQNQGMYAAPKVRATESVEGDFQGESPLICVLVPLPPRAKGLWKRKDCVETKTMSKGEAPASQKANRVP